MKKTVQALAIAAALLPTSLLAHERGLTFERVWTYDHSVNPGQASEIPAYDARTHTLWAAGVVGVDVLDAKTGALIEHIDTSAQGLVNSVAIHNGLAALALESANRTEPGVVLFYDTRTRQPSGRSVRVEVGALPDMLTFTPDGRKLLVANEATPSAYGARIGSDVPRVYGTQPEEIDPAGSVSIIDVNKRTVLATAGFAGVPLEGENLRLDTGMDFEPEYIAVSQDGRTAYVTLQEANAVGVLDIRSGSFRKVVGLGAKDFSAEGNQIDPLDDGTVSFISPDVKGLYMPDSIASYNARGRTYLVMANEGDFREDDGDRSAASSLSASAPLNRLRVSNTDSSSGDLYAAGGRSFSIRDAEGNLVYDSGDILDKAAHALEIYDDGRSRDKGVEPEGVALLEMRGRTYAFIGLERTTKSAVAVFDITDPRSVEYVDMLVGEDDLSPEGLHTFSHRGRHYLAVANEVSNTTSLYHLDKVRGKK